MGCLPVKNPKDYPAECFSSGSFCLMNSLFDKKSAVPVGVSRVVVYVPISQTKGSFMNCLVSVIVPVCNVETYLEQALNTLKSQTLCDIEVICVDDGSTDSSRSIIEGYCERDARFCLMAQNNRGADWVRHRESTLSFLILMIFLNPPCCSECTSVSKSMGRISVCAERIISIVLEVSKRKAMQC